MVKQEWGFTKPVKLFVFADEDRLYKTKVRSIPETIIAGYDEIFFVFKSKTPTNDLRELIGYNSSNCERNEYTFNEMQQRIDILRNKR